MDENECLKEEEKDTILEDGSDDLKFHVGIRETIFKGGQSEKGMRTNSGGHLGILLQHC